ncbi:MAG TPA: hypothetical protein VHO01_15590 [Jatrophihabitans sp.]|nr:hypothetical protein [Jatrophihabitans sp.]
MIGLVICLAIYLAVLGFVDREGHVRPIWLRRPERRADPEQPLIEPRLTEQRSHPMPKPAAPSPPTTNPQSEPMCWTALDDLQLNRFLASCERGRPVTGTRPQTGTGRTTPPG